MMSVAEELRKFLTMEDHPGDELRMEFSDCRRDLHAEIDRLRVEVEQLTAALNCYSDEQAKDKAECKRLRKALDFEINAHEHLAKLCGFGTLESIRERRASLALSPDTPKETEG